MSIYKDLLAARENATIVTQHHNNPGKRKAAVTLYAVLAECKMLCERCDQSLVERKEVEQLFSEQPKDGNRRYVEKGSDIYVLISRFVFASSDRTNAMRYAAAMREAGKMQIAGADLCQWLKEKGGINALYFRRPLEQRTMFTKCLRLAEQVEFSRDKPFTLTLQWRLDNSFEVVAAALT